MSTNNSDYLHLTSNKFAITCKTCGITETFYSELSVGYFRLRHGGHELVETAPNRRPWGRVNAVLHAVLDATTDEVPSLDVTTTEEAPVLDTTTEGAPSLDATTEGFPSLDTTTEEALSLDVTTEEAPVLDTTTEEVSIFGTTTEGAPNRDTTAEEGSSFDVTTKGVPSLDTTTEEAPGFDAITEGATSLDTNAEVTLNLDANGQTVEIGRVLVVTRASPVDGLPVIQVRGVNANGKTSFVVLFKHEEIGRMRQFLGSGRYQDGSAGNTVYIWDVDAIHFEEQWAEKLAPAESKNEVELQESAPQTDSVRSAMENLAPAPTTVVEESSGPALPASPRTEMPRPAMQKLRPALTPVVEKSPEPAPSVSPRTEKPRLAMQTPEPAPVVERSPDSASLISPRTEKPRPAMQKLRPALTPVVEKSPEPAHTISMQTEKARPAQHLAPAPVPVLGKTPKPAPSASPRTKTRRAKKVVVVEKKPAPRAAPASSALTALAARPARKEDETMLLAKSSYVQEGEENRREAIRISKILKAFRWNVEPIYTIGVILDDNLSIETNKGEITGDLVKQIEGIGYKLSGLTANSGKPTAWFKKRLSTRGPVVTDSERSRELQDSVEQLSNTLQEERKRTNEQKAIYEERFRLLMKLVKSTNPEAETGSVSDGSEPQH